MLLWQSQPPRNWHCVNDSEFGSSRLTDMMASGQRCKRRFSLQLSLQRESGGRQVNTPVLFLFCTAKTEKEPKRPKLVADALPGGVMPAGLNSANSGPLALHTVLNFIRPSGYSGRAKATKNDEAQFPSHQRCCFGKVSRKGTGIV